MTDDEEPIDAITADYAEESMKGVLNNIVHIRSAITRYFHYAADETNSPESVKQLRALTERLAKHWAAGVRLTIDQLEFCGAQLAPELKVTAVRLATSCEAVELAKTAPDANSKCDTVSYLPNR